MLRRQLEFCDSSLFFGLYNLHLPIGSSITLTLLVLVEEVDEIENRPLVAARELSVRTVDKLQTILLIVLAELVVIPGESCQWCNR